MLALTLCAMIGLPLSAPAMLSASVATKIAEGHGAATIHQDAPQERWLEVIEVYTLPFDPAWRETALAAPHTQFRTYFPKEAERLAPNSDGPRSREGTSKTDEKANRRRQSLREGIVNKANHAIPLTVMRVWDGISQTEVVLIFGSGEREIVRLFKPDRPVLVTIDNSAPGESLQAPRPTARTVKDDSKVPTDFAAADDAPDSVLALTFGEIDISALTMEFVVKAIKDPTPGSGVLSLTMDLPQAQIELDPRFPWYAEFRLFELGKDGKRVREVAVDGPTSLVAVDPHDRMLTSLSRLRPSPILTARGRVDVKLPKPWGYEAEIVRWFGVAPTSKLKSAPAGTAGPSGSAAPPSTPQPDATVPPVLPPEPETPEIPDSDDSPQSMR